MAFNFTIQRKLIGFSLIALVFTSVVGGSGYWLATKLGSAKDEIMRNSSDIKLQLQADQARGLLYADVLSAILAGIKKDQQQISALKQDAEERGTYISGFRQ